ncbi:hypothetical protein RIF29_20961 [Crotalaria pallida]|uniref:Uncharacterized protein n=1 Tax=Crotalaria pallida TaxID=3830 RepID=A0AAN9F4F5_CROPI
MYPFWECILGPFSVKQINGKLLSAVSGSVDQCLNLHMTYVNKYCNFLGLILLLLLLPISQVHLFYSFTTVTEVTS